MYPEDNIFNIYYNIGKRLPFQVKRVREGMYGCRNKEEFYTSKGKTFMVERIEPRGKYGKAYGYCMWDGERNDEYMKQTYPDITDGEIPCCGCGDWVLVDVPGVDMSEVFPIHKPDDIIQFGQHKGETYREIYQKDPKYIYWLMEQDYYFNIDMDSLTGLDPKDPQYKENVNKELDRVFNFVKVDDIITFGKYKGKTFRQVFKEDSQYILWFVQNNNRLNLDSESFKKMILNKE